MVIRSIRELDIRGKRLFLRVDFNVPLDSDGQVKDDTRIRRSLPTIEYAISQGAKCIIASHLGRPKGEVRPEMSLRPVAAQLGRLLGKEVVFADDCIGEKTQDICAGMNAGGVVVLENLRFHAGETRNDPEFSKALAALGECGYVNDAFGTAHRATRCRTVGVPSIMREKGAGLLMKEELENLEKAFSNPKKPVVAIFGGAKVSDKIGVLKNIVDRMDSILIGGGMANTFLKSQGVDVQASSFEGGNL